MTDEEIAEQFADNINGLDLTCSLLSAKDKSHAYRLGRYEGFLAGLKVGRPQWHDLRKDPNDLPKFEGDYMCALLNSTHSSFILSLAIEDGLKYWQDCESTDWTNEVIAWCELPTFDKE